MCEWGNTVKVKLCRPQKNSEYTDVDECIAPIVQALNDAGIETVASCCGHEKITGNIALMDGRFMEIYPNRKIYEENCPAKIPE